MGPILIVHFLMQLPCFSSTDRSWPAFVGCGSNGHLILKPFCLLGLCGASEAPTNPFAAPDGVEGAPGDGERGCFLELVLVWDSPLPRPPGCPGLQVERRGSSSLNVDNLPVLFS